MTGVNCKELQGSDKTANTLGLPPRPHRGHGPLTPLLAQLRRRRGGASPAEQPSRSPAAATAVWRQHQDRPRTLSHGLVLVVMPGLAAACILATVLASPARADAPASGLISIVLHDQAPVTGPLVTLGDLGRIEGVGERVAALGEVVVGRAPLAGRSRRISRGYVKLRLRASGLPLDDVEFGGAEEVVVSTPAAPRALAGGGPTGQADRGERSDSAGRPATQNTEEAPAVARGRPLVIRARYGLVEVRAEARAQEEGRVGDVVPVQLTTGASRILVRITGPGLAEVMR